MNQTRSIVLFLSLIFGAFANAQTTTLVSYGSVWSYLDNGSNQGTAWRGVGFNDSGWASGPAQLGYGDTDQATVTGFIDTDPGTSGTQKNATTYFRRTFPVADPSAFISATLTLLYDDAGAVFINGTEVARTSNLAAGAAYNTFASSTSADNATQSWAISPSVLVAGTNTLAVEIHQGSATSSDISFDLQLVATSMITRGPYLQMNNSSGVTVRWRTNTPTDSVIWSGTTQGILTSSTVNSISTTEHILRVSGLQPDTRYYYAVGATSGTFGGGDAFHFFQTAPASGTDRVMRLWILGDCGTADANQTAVRNAYYNSPDYRFNDMILLLGDNAYDTGTDAEFQSAIFNMYPAVLRQSPVWSCLGNHETVQGTSGNYSGIPYFDIFTFPTNAESGGYASGTERYFSWEFGNVHFISLDAQTNDATLRANMLTWLENDLAANVRRWTVAIWHHPPYTKGSHNSDTEEQLVWTRENLVPRLEGAGVDLVLCGHSHSYERSYFIDGFYATPTLLTSGTIIDSGTGAYGKDYGPHRGAVYAVAGSAGKISGGSLNHPVMLTSLNELGSMILDINGNRMDAKFINSGGVVRDAFSIEKGPIVTVDTPSPLADEYGPVSGHLTLSRSGLATNPLVVQVNLGGSATTSRYLPIALPVTIPAGASTKTIDVTPVPDPVMQGAQTVILTATTGIEYRLGALRSGTVTITDLAAGDPPVASWRLTKFGASANSEAVAGDDSDPDRDGVANLLEYALNLEPLIPSAGSLPVGDLSGGYLTLAVPKNPDATDITYRVQVSGDLSQASGWGTSDTIVLQDTPTLLEVRDNIPVSAASHRFIRLQVTRP